MLTIRVFSIQTLQYFSQIAPRVYTLVLFIIICSETKTTNHERKGSLYGLSTASHHQPEAPVPRVFMVSSLKPIYMSQQLKRTNAIKHIKNSRIREKGPLCMRSNFLLHAKVDMWVIKLVNSLSLLLLYK